MTVTLPLYIAPELSNYYSEHSVQTSLQLPPDVSRHALQAMRMQEGESCMLSDGEGSVLTVTVSDVQQGMVRCDRYEYRSAPNVMLGLVQALAKQGRDEQAIEMATEIGVDAVIPWQSQRSIVQWKPQKEDKEYKKWQQILVRATEQSRRARVPSLLRKCTTKQLVAVCEELHSQGDMIIVLHQDATTTWESVRSEVQQLAEHSILQPDDHANVPTIWVVVGPEGGITDEENQALINIGAHSIVIGSNILRASSAGSVALTLLSEALGRYS